MELRSRNSKHGKKSNVAGEMENAALVSFILFFLFKNYFYNLKLINFNAKSTFKDKFEKEKQKYKEIIETMEKKHKLEIETVIENTRQFEIEHLNKNEIIIEQLKKHYNNKEFHIGDLYRQAKAQWTQQTDELSKVIEAKNQMIDSLKKMLDDHKMVQSNETSKHDQIIKMSEDLNKLKNENLELKQLNTQHQVQLVAKEMQLKHSEGELMKSNELHIKLIDSLRTVHEEQLKQVSSQNK